MRNRWVIRGGCGVRQENQASSRTTLYYKHCRAFSTPGLVLSLAGVFPAMVCFTSSNPESDFLLMKHYVDVWIFWDPVPVPLPLNSKRWGAFNSVPEYCSFSQVAADIFYHLNKFWRRYHNEKM